MEAAMHASRRQGDTTQFTAVRQPGARPDPGLPDFEQRCYLPHKITALVAELATQGVPAAAALEGSGLDAAQLEVAATRVSYRQLAVVMRNALRLSRDPAIALRAGQRVHVTALGMYGYALLSSASFVEALAFCTTYNAVVGPLCEVVYAHDAERVTYTLEPMYWPNRTDALYRFALEFALSIHQTIVRDLGGPAFHFSELCLAYEAPDHAPAYEQIFACPVRFAQDRNALQYDARWFDRPIALADPIANAMSREVCERLLEEVNRPRGLAAEVRRILYAQTEQFPSLDAMAAMLSLHPRALRRKLEGEHTTYRELLAEVRMRRAIDYLRETRLTNEEIASRLGYSDAANFRHAFLRWTQRTPNAYRRDARAPGRAEVQAPGWSAHLS